MPPSEQSDRSNHLDPDSYNTAPIREISPRYERDFIEIAWEKIDAGASAILLFCLLGAWLARNSIKAYFVTREAMMGQITRNSEGLQKLVDTDVKLTELLEKYGKTLDTLDSTNAIAHGEQIALLKEIKGLLATMQP
jgi:hypothetical protein